MPIVSVDDEMLARSIAPESNTRSAGEDPGPQERKRSLKENANNDIKSILLLPISIIIYRTGQSRVVLSSPSALVPSRLTNG